MTATEPTPAAVQTDATAAETARRLGEFLAETVDGPRRALAAYFAAADRDADRIRDSLGGLLTGINVTVGKFSALTGPSFAAGIAVPKFAPAFAVPPVASLLGNMFAGLLAGHEANNRAILETLTPPECPARVFDRPRVDRLPPYSRN